jgi:uncharacterized protein YbjT (DUF2867 family)
MILVTGAAGTVGGEVVKGLRAAGAEFKVGYRSRRPEGLPGVALDLDRAESIAPALQGVDAVFLLSNLVSPELNLVRAAKAAGVRRIVKLSVWGAADEAFAFARWHRAVEREIEASSLAWTFLRPNGFMQNVVNYMAPAIKGQDAIYQATGDTVMSHVDARDIGAVAARVLTERGHDGRAYTLSGPEALSYGRMAETLSAVLGRRIKYVAISDEDYRQGVMAAGIPEAYADALVDLARYYRTGAAARVTGDVRAVSGRDPIGFEQFARDHAHALR